MLDLTIEKITREEDYEKISEMIYDTDPYIYRDLFGSLDSAKKVLRILLDEPKSVFYKGYYFLAVSNNEIAGLAALYKNTLEWNENVIRKAFYEARCERPESFDAVSEYFQSVFDYVTTGISACNITVAEEYKNKGVGSFLLNHLIFVAGNARMELNVLADNAPAVALYKKQGFAIETEFYDYGGYNEPYILCYKMSRNNSRHESEK